MTTPLALDTSVAVPLVLAKHRRHAAVQRHLGNRTVALCGHAAIETYAVLTRLPGDAALAPADAARLMRERFAPPLVLSASAVREVAGTLAGADVNGGATFDGVIALTALEHDALLLTRDRRARNTYDRIGARIELLFDSA